MDLAAAIDQVCADTGFSGVVRVDVRGEPVVKRGYGLADRGRGIANTVGTRFGIASGTKGLTALTVMSLIEDGALRLDTTARSLLDADLPLVADDVTVEHLLIHRSGIGDYLDESVQADINSYVMTRPVHELDTTAAYLPMLDGHPTKFAAGTDFAYCNGGYVLLALLAERATGGLFHDLVAARVCAPAGMTDTGFPRSDEPDGTVALGYLHPEGLRTNLLHLPVRGSGDGGACSTVADFHALWAAVFAGRVVSLTTVAQMVRPRSTTASGNDRYGMGCWLHRTGPAVSFEGYDAGVSFRSVHDPTSGLTYTVIGNTSEGAWPVLRRVAEVLDT